MIIQAKDWKKKVDLATMLTFNSVLHDIPGQPRGLFITKTGFQTSAKTYGIDHGIDLYTLYEVIDHIRLNITGYYPLIDLRGADPDYEWLSSEMRRLGLPKGTTFNHQMTLSTRTELYNETLGDFKLVEDVLGAHIPRLTELAPTTVTEELCEYSFMRFNGDVNLPYIKLKTITAELSQVSAGASIAIEGLVRYILKDVVTGTATGISREFKIVDGL